MHRKNNQGAIIKPIKGNNKTNKRAQESHLVLKNLKKTKNNPCNYLSYTDFLFQIGH